MTPYEQGQWDMFLLITSTEYGKQCYFHQDHPDIVYSRRSHKYMTREDAYKEYLESVGDCG